MRKAIDREQIRLAPYLRLRFQARRVAGAGRSRQLAEVKINQVLVGSGIRTSCKSFTEVAARGATHYNLRMIRSFRHKSVERFFKSGSRAGIQAAHAPRLARQLSALDAATSPRRYEPSRAGPASRYEGSLSGHWSVRRQRQLASDFCF
jgi:proteic killer suppression protein